MSSLTSVSSLPPGIEKVLARFRAMPRDEKMQALLGYAQTLDPVPSRFRDIDRAPFTVPECQTRVDLLPEYRDGQLWFYADLDRRQSPTIAAFLGILLKAINGQPPEAALAIPDDFVQQVMSGIGLAAREAGLAAMVQRIKRHARAAVAAQRRIAR
ncbi:MAG: SufE family protein [Gemmatimonadetes bacterium]|nr:SufE family protein [Gemmatimonadota bacterium]